MLKKLKLFITIISVIIVLNMISVFPDVYRKYFGNDTEKCFYQICDIIDSYNFDFAGPDLTPGCPRGGVFFSTRNMKKNNDSYEFIYDLAVRSSFNDVIDIISEMIQRINQEVLCKSDFKNNSIRFKLIFRGDGEIAIKSVISNNEKFIDKKIMLRISHKTDLENALLNLSDFESIIIGGYHGDNIIIPENFDFDIFLSMNNLVEFEIYCQENTASIKLKELMNQNNDKIWFNIVFC